MITGRVDDVSAYRALAQKIMSKAISVHGAKHARVRTALCVHARMRMHPVQHVREGVFLVLIICFYTVTLITDYLRTAVIIHLRCVAKRDGFFFSGVCLFVCIQLRISQRRKKKARGVKFCMRVGLLPGQVFSPFGELWLAESHGGGSRNCHM